MAKLLNGILGKAHNKVGNVIASSWKGINYVREYVIPKNPDTVAQQLQRGYVREQGHVAASMTSTVCQKFWDPIARNMSGFNLMMQGGLIAAKAGKELKETVRSIGRNEPTTVLSATYSDSTGDMTPTWDAVCMSNGLSTDKALIICYDRKNRISFVSDGAATRVSGTLAVAIGADRDADDLVCWVSFYRGTKKPYMISNTKGCDVMAV